MVDVGSKPIQSRLALASGTLVCGPGTIRLLREKGLPKGDVLAVSRIAGIQAAKRTSDLIPLCHPLTIQKIAIDFSVGEDRVDIHAEVRTAGQTGVEMEALTAVSVAALTLYDMMKAVDKARLVVDGQPLIWRQIECLRKLRPSELFISGRREVDYSALGLPVLYDSTPDQGLLGGIAAALEKMRGTHLLVLAVDMPGMQVNFLKDLWAKCSSSRGVVPRILQNDTARRSFTHNLEPLVAIYPAGIVSLFLKHITQGRRSACRFAAAAGEKGLIKILNVDPGTAQLFRNWNRPDQK